MDDRHPAPFHAVAHLSPELKVEFDSPDFVPTWDRGYTGGCGGTTVLGLSVETREAVDDLYADLTERGHPARQPPYDAFWGSRYAILEDPDGNPVGIMSPSDESKRSAPPFRDGRP